MYLFSLIQVDTNHYNADYIKLQLKAVIKGSAEVKQIIIIDTITEMDIDWQREHTR